MRAPVPEDRDAVRELLVARAVADLGAPDTAYEDLLEWWSSSDFELATDARVSPDGGRILAYAAVEPGGSTLVLHPEDVPAGAGEALLAWIEGRERELGRPIHRQRLVSTNTELAGLLREAGYDLARTYTRLAVSLAGAGPAGPAPDGIALRSIDRRGDAVALQAVDRAAFRSTPDYMPESVEVFREHQLDVHDYDPESSLAACRGEEIVGFLLARRWVEERSGLVNVLGVDPSSQGIGVGRVLMETAFERWSATGLERAQLGVSSENPRARRFYERLGMSPRFAVDIYERHP